jgi:P27 family predicted phage terminase small subunit
MNPKSKNQKILEGTYRPDRDKGMADRQGKLLNPPPPPEDLSGLASKIWNQTAVYLTRNKVLHQSDLHLLEIYCLAYANYHRLTLYLNDNGETYTNGGLIKLRPEAKLRLQEFDQVTKLASYFYLTPKARETMPPVEGPPVLLEFDWLRAADYEQYPTFEEWKEAHQHDTENPFLRRLNEQRAPGRIGY